MPLPAAPTTAKVPATILVVEDNPITRKMVRVALEAEGHRVIEAEDGPQALDRSAHDPPDLVFQDLNLPGMDGLELVQRLRERKELHDIPILAFSGLQSKLAKARTMRAGFTDYLFKPIEPSRLVKIIRQHLPAQPPDPARPGKGRHLLLVDDDGIQRKLQQVWFAGLGFQVVPAAGGHEALDLARRAPPDVVVSDLIMPEMDGLELCLAIRRDPTLSRIPLVIASSTFSHIEPADRDVARQAGASDLVPRTAGLEELVTAVFDSLDRPPPTVAPEAESITRQYKHRLIHQLKHQATVNLSLTQRAAQRAAELGVVSGAADLLARNADIATTVRETLARALDVGGISIGAVYLLDGAGALRLETQIGLHVDEGLSDFFGHPEILTQALARREPVVVPSAHVTEPAARKILELNHATAGLIVPLVAGGQAFGVLVLISSQLLDEPWVSAVTTLGAQLGQALALARSVGRLRESERELRDVVETSPHGILVVDDTGNIVLANRQLETTFGYDGGELIGRPVETLLPERYRVTHRGERRAFSAAPGARPMGAGRELFGLHKDGHEIPVEIGLNPMVRHGSTFVLASVVDITERKHAETRIQESERRFRQLAENTHDVFFVQDVQFRETLYISPAYETIWGRSCQSLQQNPQSFIDAVPVEDRERVFTNVAQVQAGQSPGDIEFRVVRPDGSTRWVLARTVPVRDEQGVVYRIAGVVSDITDRKLANEALTQRARLAELTAEVGIALTHGAPLRETLQRCTGALVRQLDAAFARIWTLNDEQQMLELEASAGLYTHLDGPHGRVPLGKFKIGLIAAERRPHLTNAVIGDPRVDDQEWAKREGMVAFAGYPLVVADRVVGVMAIFARHPFSDFVLEALASVADGIAVGIERKRNETSLRESEERFRALVENSGDAIALLDREGRITYASQSSTHVLDRDPAALVGTDALALLHTDDVPAVRERIQALAGRPGAVIHLEARFRSSDGQWRFGQGSLANRLHDPTVRALILNFRDVTPQRELEAQFRQAQKMEAVGRLAGGVAHDFNNLLTVITSYGELLLEDLPPGDARREDLEQIRKAAGDAAGLTRQLLAFSRQQVLEPTVLDLNTVVTGAEKMLQRLIGEDVALVSVLNPELGAIKADPGQIEQVIMNLAVNARDAMPDGGKLTVETANIELDTTYTEQHSVVTPGRYILLSVSDSGSGMDEHTRAHVFEPFFTTKDQGKGTGLGLATVYGIVKQTGGFIWVYSEPGVGTTFKLYFPRVDEAATPQVTAPPRENLRGTETVLVAEDAPAVRAVACEVLARHGYTVLQAVNGRAALTLGSEHGGPIHLLVTDVIMPEMSGRQLADRLKEIRPELKVLFVSGYTDDAITRHGVLEPGIAFLQKPFTPDSLARKVREVLSAPGSEP
jgi:two-component system, cell cycle sensor histidine kinase and response regulator CckA